MRRCHIKTLNVLCEQCQGDFLCLIKMDRMSCQLAAKAVQEEAGKHAYATYVRSYRSGCRALLNTTKICNFNNLSSCCVHALPRKLSRARVLARRRQRGVIPLSSIADPPAVVGQGCQIRIGRKKFKAVPMEIGMCALLLLLLLL